MSNALAWIQFSLQILPLILQGVLAAESAIGAGNGAQKRDMVMSPIAPALPAGADGTKAGDIVRYTVDSTVSALNRSGVFKRSATTAATA